MTVFTLIHRRLDGSFVVQIDELPYHVTTTDPLFNEVARAAEGIVLSPEPEPPVLESTPVPITQVTMRQARLALLAADLLSSVEAAIATSEKSIQIEWGFSTVIHRNSPLVLSIASSLSLKEEDVDNLFQQASNL